jgi:membrane dipeptidase
MNEDQEGLLLRRVTRLIDEHEHQGTILEQVFPASDEGRFLSAYRRSFLKQGLFGCCGFVIISTCLVAVLITVAVVVSVKRNGLSSDPYLRASSLLAIHAPFIDAHDHLPLSVQNIIQKCSYNILLNETISTKRKQELLDKCGVDLQSDLPRYAYGRVGAVSLVASARCDKISNPEQSFVEPTLKMLDIIHQIADKYSGSISLAYSYSDIWHLYRSQRLAGIIGIQGGHSIQNSLSMLRNYYRMGVRYMSLTHDCNVDWADSCCEPPKHDYGLNSFGLSVVQEMNRLGMIVDVSNGAVTTMKEAIRASKAPVMLSHTNAYDLCKNPRNIQKSVIDLLQEKKGIIMVSYAPDQVSEKERLAIEEIRSKNNDTMSAAKQIREWQKAHPNERSSINQVIDHIDYIRNVTGTVDNIGIGSDFNNGMGIVTSGLEDTAQHVHLAALLIKRGYSDEQVLKICGLNFLRVLRDVEKTSLTLQKDENRYIDDK